jgi:DNA-binding response OmpR family regulator
MPRILVVDDDPSTRDPLCKHLDDAGYEIVCASNGWEGLLALDQESADLIILDVMMPGMDGSTFLKIIRNDLRHMRIPVIIVSAFDLSEVARKFGTFDIGYFISKGDMAFYDKLLETAREILATKEGKLNSRK